MQLGVVTGQRLTDIANMQFRDIQDSYLHVRQQKHGAMLRLSLKSKIDVLGVSLGDIVAHCRDRVVSRHLIHHTRNWNSARAGEAVHPDSISEGFRRARNVAGLKQDGKPPPFHELRSLAGRLYDKQDGISAQSVLGHKDPATTARYILTRAALRDFSRVVLRKF
jgi:integrase